MAHLTPATTAATTATAKAAAQATSTALATKAPSAPAKAPSAPAKAPSAPAKAPSTPAALAYVAPAAWYATRSSGAAQAALCHAAWGNTQPPLALPVQAGTSMPTGKPGQRQNHQQAMLAAIAAGCATVAQVLAHPACKVAGVNQGVLRCALAYNVLAQAK